MNESTSEITKVYTPPVSESKPALRLREEAIRKAVLSGLGTPENLLRVTVVPVWGNNFRVNVWTSARYGAGIPHSYFVTADPNGSVLDCEPPIRKQY